MSRIKTWQERCESHPDHQSGMVTHAMIQARMQEEIDELRDTYDLTRAQASAIALGVIDPWLNGDPCKGCRCDKVCKKLKDRIVSALLRGVKPGAIS